MKELSNDQYKELMEFNQGTNTFEPSHSLVQLFELQCSTTPDAIAIEFEQESLSYHQLNNKANQVANGLIHSGVGPGQLVGVCADRSIELIVSILGILKSGAGYVPFDPSYPEDRITFMLKQANLKEIITTHKYHSLFSDSEASIKIISNAEHDFIDASESNTEVEFNPESAVYVLFTSGSTGMPKGVEMNQRAVLNLLEWQATKTSLGNATRTLQFAPISFDVSFQEIFSTLTTGGTLIMVDDEMRLNAILLLEFIESKKIERLFLPFIALQHLSEVAQTSKIYPSSLSDIITAGEQLQITKSIRNLFTHLPHCKLHNHYGPTETHVVTAYTLSNDPNSWSDLPPIGIPVSNAHIYILDDNLLPVKKGNEGEIYVSGAPLATGYINNIDLTNERFVVNPFLKEKGSRMYKTGDLGRYLNDGNIEYTGRADNQLKIRGYRIEPGEVEVALLMINGVNKAVVVAREDVKGDKRLVAYLVADDKKVNNVSTIRKFLSGRLPEYMIPSAFIFLDNLPLTPSGKVDRKSLPAPDNSRPELDTLFVAPETDLEKKIASVWMELLRIDKVGVNDNFFYLGGNSLLALQFIARVKHEYSLDIPVVRLYQYPSIRDLIKKSIGGHDRESVVEQAKSRFSETSGSASGSKVVEDGIAIIGLAGRFPGADNVDQLWENLINGKETTKFFGNDELDDFIDPKIKSDPSYVKARGVINDADKFDAGFFNFNPRLSDLMDPQHRVFLEVCWEAIENSGYNASAYHGLVGVFAGTGNNTYFANNVSPNKDIIDKVGSFQVMVANEKDYIATRVSHFMNLKGPAISVHTACSTSLTAVAMACQSLWNQQSDMAIAGGISITSPINSGHLYIEGGMFSSDGHTRPFDEQASGTVFSDGCGVVVLKRYKDAVHDGDTICAVVRGVGINNDGSDKASFTAPSVEGQAAAIAMAHASANVNADSVSYIETHGTATPLGDPIEIEALTLAFGETGKDSFCAVGSIKSNFGHLTAAAGIAGLIKTSLAIKNRIIPATLNYSKSNPAINFQKSPFYVNNELMKWEHENLPLRAGVSSFGVGGTNVHVVLEEAPLQEETGISRPAQLFLFSTKSKEQTEKTYSNFKTYLSGHPEINLADASYTLQVGRVPFRNRKYVVIDPSSNVVDQLSKTNPQRTGARQLEQASTGVAFMFPGQGSQYVNMGLSLYKSEVVFKEAVDKCCELLKEHLQTDLKSIIYPESGSEDKATKLLKDTCFTQPALFTIGFALSQLWQSWGVQPKALIGHSIGEFCAACVAGVMSLEDAVFLVAQRGKMMQELPSGSMLSVRTSADNVLKYLNEKTSVAAVNGPSLCVVSGDHESINKLKVELEADNIICKELHTSHAFHSVMMDPIVEPFKNITKSITLNPAKIKIYSTATASILSDNEATSPEYWSLHLRNPVRFADGIKMMWEDEPGLFLLELGPRNTASTLAKQQATDLKKQFAVPSLADKTEENAEWISILNAVGQLWLSGIEIDWNVFYALEHRRRIPLPTYPFIKERHWIEPVNTSKEGYTHQPITSETLSQFGKAINIDNNLITDNMSNFSRKESIISELRIVMEEASGIDLESADNQITFLELGMDSLFLTQAALTISKKYGVKVTFRQLNEQYASLDSLASFIDESLPADALPHLKNLAGQAANLQSQSSINASTGSVSSPGSVQWLIEQQMQIMQQQLAALSSVGSPVSKQQSLSSSRKTPVNSNINITEHTESEKAEKEKPFGAIARIEKSVNTDLNEAQKKWLSEFTIEYNAKTKKSKEYTQLHRAHLADPRVVTGFKPNLKELIYQAVVDRSEGCRLWDIDGNEYIDVLNGFGSNFLGYNNPVIMKAVESQLKQGIEIGPQHPLAGELTKLICEFSGYDRAGLCNTGSEAVLGAMRIARTITGRSTIVCFNGSYHGINDEVIVRGSKNLKSFPAAAGIMPESVQNMLVLDYGTDEALEIIKSKADEIAAVLVEPIQSRRADFRPTDFLKEVRKITSEHGAVLIFDEVITGFRLLPGGAQQFFNIEADISTYGKVIGGGMPIGAIAGRKEFMDALDGGYWEFGNQSVPEAGVTYFAGTFVRHPLALAAGTAVLKHLKERGNEIYEKLNGFTDKLVNEVNLYCKQKGAPFHLVSFGSLFKAKWNDDVPYSELLYLVMRNKGVHIYDGFPCFITDAFDDKDISFVINTFKQSIDELQSVGLLIENANKATGSQSEKHKQNGFSDEPPVKGAKKGKDKNGNTAWFIEDPDRPGKYVQVSS